MKALISYLFAQVAEASCRAVFLVARIGAPFSHLRRYSAPVIGILIALTLYQLNQLPSLSRSESAELASHFRFTKSPFPELNGNSRKSRRILNPSFESISAWISSVGAAVALADLDGDGLPNDLCYVDPRTDLVTVACAPGMPARYEAFALAPGSPLFDSQTMAPMGSLVCDLNEDGLMDVLVYYWGRTPIAFLRRAGAASMLKSSDFITGDIIPTGERWYTSAATLADLDGDGHIDIVIGNYFQDGARVLDANATSVEELHDSKANASNGGRNHLLLWVGGTSGEKPTAQYIDVRGAMDEKAVRGWTLAVGAIDLDGDFLPEIYLANDFGHDMLLHNRSKPGDLRFVAMEGKGGFAVPTSFVMGRDSFKGMGVDFGDLNGDGWPDIFVSAITSPLGLEESNFLWLSTGETNLLKEGTAPYAQASEELGLSRSGWGWDCRLADFDNDGSLEAIQATGFIKGRVNRWPELQSLGTANSEIMHDPRLWPRFQVGDDVSGSESNPFFVRARDGRYYDIASELGLSDPMVSRGIAIADVEGDGRLDFAVANQWETSFFFHNDSPDAGKFLGLHLLLSIGPSTVVVRPGHPGGDTRGRPAIGAVATVRLPDGRELSSQVDGGSGHSGKRSPDLHFGLGGIDNQTQLQVDLRWRDAGGEVRQKSIRLPAGWHTVLLN